VLSDGDEAFRVSGSLRALTLDDVVNLEDLWFTGYLDPGFGQDGHQLHTVGL
jgi:hypothetical protein